jgi:mRNA interferase HigB
LRINGREKVIRFGSVQADALGRLNNWVKTVESAIWKMPDDVRKTFRTVDFVENKAVFDIGGNKYRLIASISFKLSILSIQHILTHKEYDRGKWK